MTAPVSMDWQNGKSLMSFVMPQGYDLQNLPQPLNAAIQLEKYPSEYAAVLRFGGYASDKIIETKKLELAASLKKAGIRHNAHFRFLGYNAPWDFLFRRNEIIALIDRQAIETLI